MQKGLPPLGWLRTFEAAARHLSFTGAAHDLNMTQSAVSQQVKSLEAFLGRPLFHRRPRVLELTETGITYLPVVREAFRTLHQGTRAVTGLGHGEIQLQCNLTFAVHWLAPRLPALRRAHPQVRLNISTELWEPREMAQGADVEIRYSLRPADTVRADLLHRDHYYPVCAPGYDVRRDTLAEQPLYDCSNLLANWRGWAEFAEIPWPDPFVTYATTFTVVLPIVTAGGGLCLVHDVIARELLSSGQLIAPFPERVPMPEAYYLIQTPQAEDRPEVQVFVAWLKAQLAESGREGTHA